MIDSIIEEVKNDLTKRSEVGIKKYNTTLDRKDLSLYLKRAIKEL